MPDEISFFEGIEFNATTGKISGRCGNHTLTRVPRELLRFLIRNHGREVTFEDIISAVWVPGEQVGRKYAVRTHIWAIRRCLGDKKPFRLILNCSDGYKFVPQPTSKPPQEDPGPHYLKTRFSDDLLTRVSSIWAGIVGLMPGWTWIVLVMLVLTVAVTAVIWWRSPRVTEVKVHARPEGLRNGVFYTPTGVKIMAGDHVVLHASGRWNSGSNITDANGNPRDQCNCVVPGPNGALVGRIGNGGIPFLVGANKSFRSAEAGELWLTINDLAVPGCEGKPAGGCFEDNTGSLEVQIAVGK